MDFAPISLRKLEYAGLGVDHRAFPGLLGPDALGAPAPRRPNVNGGFLPHRVPERNYEIKHPKVR
jgi:hypothetical protein